MTDDQKRDCNYYFCCKMGRGSRGASRFCEKWAAPTVGNQDIIISTVVYYLVQFVVTVENPELVLATAVFEYLQSEIAVARAVLSDSTVTKL